MVRHARVVGCVALFIVAACGSDDGGSSKVSSGLPPDEKLSALDGADAMKLCTSMASSLNGVVTDTDRERISCTVLALPQAITISGSGEVAGDVGKCQMLVSKCMSGESISEADPAFELPETFVDEETQCSATEASSKVASCDATVEEFETCATAMVGQLQAQLSILDCKSLSDPKKLMSMSSEKNDLDIDKQPECKALVEKCPDIDFGS